MTVLESEQFADLLTDRIMQEFEGLWQALEEMPARDREALSAAALVEILEGHRELKERENKLSVNSCQSSVRMN